MYELMRQAADAIEELQSRVASCQATIERQSDIIKAKDRDLQRAIDAKPQWISVAERLPSVGEKVLVITIGKGKQYVETDMLLATGEWFDYGNITHWMPLPEPPKEGE